MNLVRKHLRHLILESFSQRSLATTRLSSCGKDIEAEVADTEASRNLGLMFRKDLSCDAGMIFVFPDESPRSFWMKNTIIPLSIAFIDSRGVIINIENLYPGDMNSKHSAGPAKYALEMNAGWFHKNGVFPGSVVKNLPT